MITVIEHLLTQVEKRAAVAVPIDICIGVHWTLVTLETAGALRAGLASTLVGRTGSQNHSGHASVADAGRLLALSADRLVSLTQSDSLLEASVGMATINALLEINDSQCFEINAADLIAKQGCGRRVAVVGHFPFVSRLREVVETLWVLELDPNRGDRPAAEAPQLLPQADVVALTGTSLLNRTFDDLISYCRDDAFVVILGATTPVSSLFFDYGVDAVSGTLVVDIPRIRLAVSQGANYRQLPGKRLLTMLRTGTPEL